MKNSKRLQPILNRDALVATLFALADDFAQLAGEWSERLNYEEHSSLSEYETKLLAFGNLLAAADARRFVTIEMQEATDYLTFVRSRLGLPPGDEEDQK